MLKLSVFLLTSIKNYHRIEVEKVQLKKSYFNISFELEGGRPPPSSHHHNSRLKEKNIFHPQSFGGEFSGHPLRDQVLISINDVIVSISTIFNEQLFCTTPQLFCTYNLRL